MMMKVFGFLTFCLVACGVQTSANLGRGCRRAPPDSSGPCSNPTTVATVYAYNDVKKMCESWMVCKREPYNNYTNKYHTEEHCLDTCNKYGRCDEAPGAFGFYCKDNVWETRYSYNPLTNKCGKFAYGGCGGTANRFLTLAKCTDTCVKQQDKNFNKAICELLAKPSDPRTKRGTVTLTQFKGENVKVIVDLHSVPINIAHATHERGLHVHYGGKASLGCRSVAGHYNPSLVAHGSRDSSKRHHGDFGNIKCTRDGLCFESFEVTGLTLFGAKKAIGKSIVLHDRKDDLGVGGNLASRVSGNEGRRIACCTIKQV